MASSSFRDLLPEGVLDETLEQALTHRSMTPQNNERLEFLGDAVLGLVIADALYQRLPQAKEGDLTRMRATLVNRESLADLARAEGIEGHVNLGDGERKSGGQRRASILADALEAVIGVCYAQAGFAAARQFVLAVYAERLAHLPSMDSLKDPKTRLQEWLQGRGEGLPEYRLLGTVGPDHQREFEVEVWLTERSWGMRAQGASRRRAEQAAAELAMSRLQEEHSRR